MVLISWDDRKNEQNFKKHGIWFEEAQSVILNPISLLNLNRHDSGNRIEYLGHSDQSQLLYVVSVEKSEDSIRIISARKATKTERRKYEEGI
jgi:uncharacterized protein